MLLAARMLGEPLEVELPKTSAILEATGVTRSRAYEAAAEVVEFLQHLSRPVGRPPARGEAAQPPRDDEAVSRAVLGFVMTHPGCVHGQGQRQRYCCGARWLMVSHARWLMGIELSESLRAWPLMAQMGKAPAS